jgi:thioredoxin 1
MQNQVEIIDLKKMEDFINLSESSKKQYILCDFYADWCGPCKNIAKVLPEIYYPYSKYFEFVKINVDNPEFDELASKCNVTKIPTFVAFYDNVTKQITTSDVVQLKSFMNSLIPLNESIDF